MSVSYQPELGQMAFGNPWGRYAMTDYQDALLEGLLSEIDRVYWNVNQEQWERYDALDWVAIQFRPYYWGDCTCGFDALDEEWSETHHCTETCFHTRYHRESESFKGDSHDHMTAWAKANGYPQAPNGMAVYCDCGSAKEYQEWRTTHDHDPKCPTVAPNFSFEDVEIRWYKHPGRGTSVNKTMNPTEWAEWYERCLTAIRALDLDIYASRREGHDGNG